MFFNDHEPAHFHAVYAEFNGIFNIETLEMTEGDMPNRAIRLIQEWAEPHKATLADMWKTKQFIKLPGLQ